MPDNITAAALLPILSHAREAFPRATTAQRTQALAEDLKGAAEALLALGRLEDRHARWCRAYTLCAAESALTLALVRRARDVAARLQVAGSYGDSEAELVQDVRGQLGQAFFFCQLWEKGASPWDAVIARYMAESQTEGQIQCG